MLCCFAIFIFGIDGVFFDTWCLLMPRFSILADLFGLELEIAQCQMELIFERKSYFIGPQDNFSPVIIDNIYIIIYIHV